MGFDKNTKLNRVQQRESYFKEHWPNTYKKIIMGTGHSWQENLYLYINDSVPHTCPVCGSPTKFIGMWKGYNKFCSPGCSNKANSDKTANTKLLRYGSSGFNNREKSTKTCLKKYGVPAPSQSQSARQKLSKPHSQETRQKMSTTYWTKTVKRKSEIQHKRAQTIQSTYGTTNTMLVPDIKEKLKNTFIERYGYAPGTNLEFREASLVGILEKTKRTHPEFIEYVSGGWKCSCPHDECNKCQEKFYITLPDVHRMRVKGHSELCTRLLPIGVKTRGTTIELFIRQLLDTHNIEHIDNSFSILPGHMSLDVYIPSKKIAIECNGCYWHSSIYKEPKDHYRKFKICQSLGIQLITIWEDWIVNKPDIVSSLILNKLGMTPNKIWARHCIIKEVSPNIATKFYNTNHIQGRCNSKVRLGLYYNDDLVSVMSFNNRSALSGSKNININEWELVRFCNKLNTTVVGGASKLLKYFISHFKPSKIVSFSSNDISIGSLYKTLGFTKFKESVGYWYIKNGPDMTRYHRSTFTKDSLIRKGLAPSNNKNEWTEADVMQTLPYYKIFDSGTTGWTLDINHHII